MGETATIRDIIKGVDKPKLITRTFPWPKDSGRGGRRSRQGRAPAHVPEATKKESVQKWVEISEFVTVGELAAKLEIPANEIIKFLMKLGIIAGINQNLSFENSASVAKNFGYKVEKEKQAEVKPEEEEDEENLLSPRPPVVTVLGHVDHGKTSLLDAIRNTNVTASESGGITQNIGASTIDLDNRKIVFIDTPGHEAFTAMRARGAQVTDIAVLVVAADDGVMPQTIEAISHAKAAKVPIIVAINKIDKAEANPEKVKQQLTEFDFLPEDWGGSTVMVPVSAKTKAGINDMLEMILLVADMEELKANPHRKAQGIIIESKLDKGVGPVATVIVQNGTLKVGDAVVVGNEWGRIRIMINDKGKKTRKALPSYPVEIVGLSGVPAAGDLLQVVDDEKVAKTISEGLKLQQRSDRMSVSNRISLEDLFEQMKRGETKELNLIIKADVNGALEALKNSIVRLSNQEVRINVIYGGIGTITESDVMLATASNAIIIGFNVRPDPITRRLAEQEKVDVRLYRVIYHAIQDIKAAMVGLLEPEYEEALLGRAEVRAIFKISKVGVVAGLYVIEGKLVRNAKIRVLRDHVVIYEGKIDSLRRFKDDVREIATGFEGGIFIEKFPAFQSGDIIEAYTLQEIKRDSIEIDGTMVSIKKD
jgi:translation initiation factor IF-2